MFISFIVVVQASLRRKVVKHYLLSSWYRSQRVCCILVLKMKCKPKEKVKQFRTSDFRETKFRHFTLE
jgi:hypothetical protein